MEIIVSLIAWLFLLAALLLLPALLYVCLGLRRSKKTAGVAALLCAAVIFFGGMLMLMVGLAGEYIGRTYISVNNAPQYVIRETTENAEQ